MKSLKSSLSSVTNSSPGSRATIRKTANLVCGSAYFLSVGKERSSKSLNNSPKKGQLVKYRSFTNIHQRLRKGISRNSLKLTGSLTRIPYVVAQNNFAKNLQTNLKINVKKKNLTPAKNLSLDDRIESVETIKVSYLNNNYNVVSDQLENNKLMTVKNNSYNDSFVSQKPSISPERDKYDPGNNHRAFPIENNHRKPFTPNWTVEDNAAKTSTGDSGTSKAPNSINLILPCSQIIQTEDSSNLKEISQPENIDEIKSPAFSGMRNTAEEPKHISSYDTSSPLSHPTFFLGLKGLSISQQNRNAFRMSEIDQGYRENQEYVRRLYNFPKLPKTIIIPPSRHKTSHNSTTSFNVNNKCLQNDVEHQSNTRDCEELSNCTDDANKNISENESLNFSKKQNVEQNEAQNFSENDNPGISSTSMKKQQKDFRCTEERVNPGIKNSPIKQENMPPNCIQEQQETLVKKNRKKSVRLVDSPRISLVDPSSPTIYETECFRLPDESDGNKPSSWSPLLKGEGATRQKMTERHKFYERSERDVEAGDSETTPRGPFDRILR